MIPYLRTENLKNGTLWGGTYLYRPRMGVPPPPRGDVPRLSIVKQILGVHPGVLTRSFQKQNNVPAPRDNFFKKMHHSPHVPGGQPPESQ